MSLEKPRFRRDLEARPVVADGQSYVEVRDVPAGKSFLFYDFEYQVALAFDGLPLEKVIPWVKLATGLTLQVDQLREFVQRLDELGFLECELGQEIQAGETEAPAAAEPPAAESIPSSPGPAELPAVPGAAGSDQEQRVRNAELSATLPDRDGVMSPPPATLAEQPASNTAHSAEADEPAREETPGPPPPDAVVMHPGEVVGETPPPVTMPMALSSESERASLAPREKEVVSEMSTTEPAAGPGAPADAEPPEPADAAPAEAAPPSEPAPETAPPEEVAQNSAPDAPAAADEAAGVLGDERETVAEAILHKDSPAERTPTDAVDSTAFPVLPVNRSPSVENAAPSAPPAWTTPRPLTTPRPVTLGPIVDGPSVRRRTRRSLVLFGTLGVLAAVALLAVVLPFVFSARQPSPVQARTQTITLGTVYRYFDGAAPIVAVPGPVLRFPAAGKVGRVAGKGTAIALGDVVAALEAARGLQIQLVHQRERLAYYQQMAEAMHQVGNSKEEERQLATVEARKAGIAQTLRELGAVAIVANAAGEVEESLVHEGQTVDRDSPAVRLRSPGFRVTLELGRAPAAAARRLGFCQVEVEGYLLDCSPALAAGDETHVAVDLASVPPALVGKPAHLARARYNSATVLPVAALQVTGSRVGVFVVPVHTRLEMRPVVVADRDDAEAIVVQGLDPGDRVVIQPVQSLRPGLPVVSVGSR